MGQAALGHMVCRILPLAPGIAEDNTLGAAASFSFV